ncbi:cytochrome c biogenesis protein DipZ [Pseudomonas sp. SH1-B]
MLLIAFLAGMLTVVSPCILPVVPFLFARTYHSRSSIAWTLAGMALTFTLVSSLAVATSDWLIRASEAGQRVALLGMALFALSLISSRLATCLSHPFTLIGNRLAPAQGTLPAPLAALSFGVATGLLWAPCAGPILGLILTSAMLRGASVETSLLLLAYATGSALALGTLILGGRSLIARLRLSPARTTWLRRAAGVCGLLAVSLIATGADSKLLAITSSQGINATEQVLLDELPKVLEQIPGAKPADSSLDLPVLAPMPALDGAVEWLNSGPLTRESLRGKVVLVDFWTYDCINCQHTLPYVKEWARKYGKDGLVVIGVHTPEYAFEKVIGNVRAQVGRLGITYPVAVDNRYAIWRAFDNRYWPAHYFVDGNGQIRYSHFGEGKYEYQERVIQQLLKERETAQKSSLETAN